MECACEMSETKNEGIFTHGSCPTGQMSPQEVLTPVHFPLCAGTTMADQAPTGGPCD